MTHKPQSFYNKLLQFRRSTPLKQKPYKLLLSKHNSIGEIILFGSFQTQTENLVAYKIGWILTTIVHSTLQIWRKKCEKKFVCKQSQYKMWNYMLIVGFAFGTQIHCGFWWLLLYFELKNFSWLHSNIGFFFLSLSIFNFLFHTISLTHSKWVWSVPFGCSR